MNYFPLEKLINLYDGYRQVFIVERKEVLLIQEEGKRFAVQANCPHRQWPLQNANINGSIIACSKHGWEFNLESGRACNRQAECDLLTYKVGYNENTIGILIE